MSIADHQRQSVAYDPAQNRHPICIALEALLDQVIEDQKQEKSAVAEAISHEFGNSMMHMVMVAAGIRKIRIKHAKNERGEPDEIASNTFSDATK